MPIRYGFRRFADGDGFDDVDIDEMLISQPDTGEQALEITDTLVRSGGVDIVVNGRPVAKLGNDGDVAERQFVLSGE